MMHFLHFYISSLYYAELYTCLLDLRVRNVDLSAYMYTRICQLGSFLDVKDMVQLFETCSLKFRLFR